MHGKAVVWDESEEDYGTAYHAMVDGAHTPFTIWTRENGGKYITVCDGNDSFELSHRENLGVDELKSIVEGIFTNW